MTGFFEDGEKITYPEADRLVDEFIAEMGSQKAQATSRDILEYHEVPDITHNQRRVHDALTQCCVPTEANWAGRTVFELPADSDN